MFELTYNHYYLAVLHVVPSCRSQTALAINPQRHSGIEAMILHGMPVDALHTSNFTDREF